MPRAHLSLLCWVEQVAEHPGRGALFSLLHQYRQVLGRRPDVLYVRFQAPRGDVREQSRGALLRVTVGNRCDPDRGEQT
jgi:hypothetical protein